jgi:CRP-like cAMP-binding protein
MLQQTPLFGGIREDVLAFLLSVCRDVRVPKGEFFFREDEPGDSMYVLESGSVEVRKRAPHGELLLSRLGAGDCIGEMAMIDLAPRSASVLAVEDCGGFEIFAASLYQLYERDVEQFALIQMNMARELSRRLRISDDHQLDLLSRRGQ